MSSRFLYNSLLALAAGFLVVATMAFAPVTAAWLTFGIAVGAVTLSTGTIALRTGLVQRLLTVVALVIGIWTIVASLVFPPTTVVWLGFASAIALVALAFAGLTAHEIMTDRVVHSLTVDYERPRRREMERDSEPVAA
jgi:hypothetical protein